jgi:hypothetical protein
MTWNVSGSWNGAGAVANTAPVANAGIDQLNIGAGATVTLNGASSSDADSNALTYLWTPPAGITLSSNTVASPTFTAPTTNAPQTLIFSLVVNDGTENSIANTVNIGVLAEVVGNVAPVANAGTGTTGIAASTLVTMDFTGSTDGDGTIVSYSVVENTATGVTITGANTATPSFTTGLTAETYTFTVTVTDNGGLTDTSTVTYASVAYVYPSVDPYLTFSLRFDGALNTIKVIGGDIVTDVSHLRVLRSAIDELSQHSDNTFKTAILDVAGRLTPLLMYSDAEYIISRRSGEVLLRLILGNGIEKSDEYDFITTIDDGALTFKGNCNHQFVVYDMDGNKLPPIFNHSLYINRTYINE